MDDSPIDFLPRVRRLEMFLGLALLLAAISTVGFGVCYWKLSQPITEFAGTLYAQGFEVRSPSGETKGSFSANGTSATLEMRGSLGKKEVVLTSAGVGGALDLSTREGGEFASIGPGTGNGSALTLRGSEGRQVLYAGVTPRGDGNVTLRSKSGDVMVALSSNFELGGSIGTFGAGEQKTTFLGTVERGAGGMMLWNEDGKPFLRAATSESKEGFLSLEGTTGGVASLSIKPSGDPLGSFRAPGTDGFLSLSCDNAGGWWSLGDKHGRLRANAGMLTDGTSGIKVLGEDQKEASVMCDSAFGGFFQAYSRTGNVTFGAGCDDRSGSGHVSLFHPTGARLFWAGCTDEETSGLIRVRALDGKLLLNVP